MHNIVLSMPGRTPPEAVLAAAREFASLNFALQYPATSVVLHTDLAHPHVHLIVKAEHDPEPGRRLTNRKVTLRQWSDDFAAYMRREGVAANATAAALRGRPRTSKKDPIHQRLRSLAQYEALPSEAQARTAPPVDSNWPGAAAGNARSGPRRLARRPRRPWKSREKRRSLARFAHSSAASRR